MFKVYIYVLDTLADWELGYVTAELNSGRFFKKGAPEVSVKTVAISKEPVKTMGGLTIVPDCSISDIEVDEKSVLLLPGANTWDDPKHGAIIKKAGEFLSAGAMVCAICGATAALANAGLLDQRPHTSKKFSASSVFFLCRHCWQIKAICIYDKVCIRAKKCCASPVLKYAYHSSSVLRWSR